ncbi:MAG: hypothetical protein ACREEW_04550 [Caulobacteraceae bacterium]
MYIYGYHILLIALWAAAALTTAFALWKGDAAVKYGALTHLAVEVLTFVVNPRFGDVGAESILLALDFGCSVVYLLLAVRFANLWLGAAMLLQAAVFSLHAYYLVMELPHDRLHAWINNTCDWGIMISICVGTVLAIRRRAAMAREAAELEALRQQRATRMQVAH